MKKILKTKQEGLTLIELVAGLAIVAAVIVGALALFQNVNTTQKSGQIVTDTTALRTTIRHLYNSTGRYEPVNANINNVLARSGKLPTNIRAETSGATTSLSHSFNNQINAIAMGTWFYVQYDGIPQDACLNVLTGSASWSRITVNMPPTGPMQPLSGSVLQTPINATGALNACSSDENNTIYFVSN